MKRSNASSYPSHIRRTTTKSSSNNVVVRFIAMFATLIVKRYNTSVAIAFSIIRNNNHQYRKIISTPVEHTKIFHWNRCSLSKFYYLLHQRRSLGTSGTVTMYIEDAEEIDDATISILNQNELTKKVNNDNLTEDKTRLFEVTAEYKPAGDQPEAIRQLAQYIESGHKFSILQGITGTGKTLVMSHIIANANKPCLVLCHNKTLAAQLARELRSFLRNNAVEFFVSYYNHYTPESYVETTGKYIAKKSSINAEIDALRHRATRALLIRSDVVVVASVSCIYGLGLPEEYVKASQDITVNQQIIWKDFINIIHSMLYELNDNEEDFDRSKYQISIDTEDMKEVLLWPPHAKFPLKIQLERDLLHKHEQQDHMFRISAILEGKQSGFDNLLHTRLFPARHHVTSGDKLEEACIAIEEELEEQLTEFKNEGKVVEADRLQKRVLNDLYMLRETGFCSGGENYSRHFAGRLPGMAPSTFIDFIGHDHSMVHPRDWLLIVDESHVTLPQLSAMYAGDQARKHKLVKHGYRLPSALDNRPLKSSEFWERIQQTVFVSATPASFERSLAIGEPVEMIIRPTFVCDPEIEIRPTTGQLEDFLKEARKLVTSGSRGLVTTLTKRDAEDLSNYLNENDVKSLFIHSSVTTHERSNSLKALQNGDIDILVGVNLLREGLDLPQVSLVAILNADAEGFLRCETSLLQTVGRAARNINGKAIFYANRVTKSMQKCIDITTNRREKQMQYNQDNDCVMKSTKGSSVQSIFDLLKDKIDAEGSLNPSTPSSSNNRSNHHIPKNGTSHPSVSMSINQSHSKHTFVTDHIPTDSGVYFWKDSKGTILYIGKAVKLRSRIKSYLSTSAKHSRRIRLMLERAATVEFVLTPSERDALVLESNLIKHHQPPFNVLLKDDGHYPYICASIGDPVPRLSVVPQKHEPTMLTKDYRYYGPYTSMKEINSMLALVEDQYNLRSQAFLVRHGSLPRDEYKTEFDKMMEEVFEKPLKKEWMMESDELVRLRTLYEEAGLLFDSKHNRCKDVIGIAHNELTSKTSIPNIIIVVIQLRDGLVAGSYKYECTAPFFTTTDNEDLAEIIRTILLQRHYPSAPSGGYFSWFPDEVLLPLRLQNETEFKTQLKKICKSVATPTSRVTKNFLQVTFLEADFPSEDALHKQETNRRTLEFARQNAKQIAAFRFTEENEKSDYVAKELYDGTATTELAALLSLDRIPERIECYDISHTQGQHPVASRVVFIDGRPARHLYRLFNIRDDDGGDDYASMEQVLERRFRRLKNVSKSKPTSSDENREAWSLPDLIVVDGGKGQLASAMRGIDKAMTTQNAVTGEERKFSIPICALAKGEEQVFIPGNSDPVNASLDSSLPAILLLRALRDESHRFALNAHRRKRSLRKSVVKS